MISKKPQNTRREKRAFTNETLQLWFRVSILFSSICFFIFILFLPLSILHVGLRLFFSPFSIGICFSNSVVLWDRHTHFILYVFPALAFNTIASLDKKVVRSPPRATMQHDDDVNMYDEQEQYIPTLSSAAAAASNASAESMNMQYQQSMAYNASANNVENPRSQWGPPIDLLSKRGVKRTHPLEDADDDHEKEVQESHGNAHDSDDSNAYDSDDSNAYDSDDSNASNENKRVGPGAGQPKAGSQLVLKSNGILTVREEEVAELVFSRFRTEHNLVSALKKQGILDPKKFIGGTWKQGKLTAGCFLTNMFVKARDNASLKQKIIYVLADNKFLQEVANDTCGLEDDWMPMPGAWQAKPEIMVYQEQHPGAVLFSDIDPRHQSQNYKPAALSAAAAASADVASRQYQSKAPLPDQRWPLVRYKPSLCVRDCGAGGDCLFKSIAWALNKKFNENLSHKAIRALCADELTEADLPIFNAMFFQASEDDMQNARRYKKNKNKNAFTLAEMRKTLKTAGMGYQGDSSMLALLGRSTDERLHDTGFIIFEQDGNFYHLEDIPNKIYTHYLLLYHMTSMEDEDGNVGEVLHFQLAGWMNDEGRVNCVLHLDEIPDPLWLQLCADFPQHNLCSTK
jgi:hypothetical protein